MDFIPCIFNSGLNSKRFPFNIKFEGGPCEGCCSICLFECEAYSCDMVTILSGIGRSGIGMAAFSEIHKFRKETACSPKKPLLFLG